MNKSIQNNYEVSITVRDYECDSQGIVNNAVYNNYFEHARNTVIKNLGYNLYELHKKGEDAVVARAEIDYKNPLQSGDECVVKTRFEIKGSFKILFFQEIINKKDTRLCAKAIFTVAVIANGRPLAIKQSVFAKLL